MKIKTITCHHAYNHGAMLQAYALQQFLSSHGHDVEVIDYRPNYMPDCEVDFKYVPLHYNKFGLRWLYRLAKIQDNKLEQKRREAFEAFFKKFIRVTKHCYRDIEDLQNNPPQADLYIAGSDQIWNTVLPNGKDAAFYLDFGNSTRKISYAASFATDKIEEPYEDFVKQKLRNFNAITIREYSGINLLKSLGYEGRVVVDPVFLLDVENWDIFYNHACENEDFVLTYDFEKKGSEIGEIAIRLAETNNCKIFSVGPFNVRYADKSFVAVGPDTFVSLIKNARCVISNSFHATAFSIIFKKNFFVVNRKDGLNSRMKDLLKHYGLSNRLINKNITAGELNKDVQYSNMQSLYADIIDSRDILLSHTV